MRYISKWLFFIIFIFTLIHVSPVHSINEISSGRQDNELRVGVIPLEPFVMIQDGKHKGISIELWEEIARIHGWQYKYTILPESGYIDIEPLLKANKLDIVIGPVAITYKRINEIAFSIPYFITTSNLITKDVPLSFSPLLIHFFKRVFSLPLIIVFLIVLLCSFLIWLKERKYFPDNFPQSVYRGIPYSIWYGFHSIFSGDIFFEIKDTYSRILTVIMLLCSVTLVSIIAASLTSALTLSHLGLSSNIGELSQLRNQPVAIISGTDVKGYLHDLEAKVVLEGSLPEAVESLKNDEVVAIIGDKLLMSSYLKQHKNVSKINITNIVIRSNIMAFALSKESKLKDSINDSIVHLQNSDWIYKMCLMYLSRREAAFCTL